MTKPLCESLLLNSGPPLGDSLSVRLSSPSFFFFLDFLFFGLMLPSLRKERKLQV